MTLKRLPRETFPDEPDNFAYNFGRDQIRAATWAVEAFGSFDPRSERHVRTPRTDRRYRYMMTGLLHEVLKDLLQEGADHRDIINHVKWALPQLERDNLEEEILGEAVGGSDEDRPPRERDS